LILIKKLFKNTENEEHHMSKKQEKFGTAPYYLES